MSRKVSRTKAAPPPTCPACYMPVVTSLDGEGVVAGNPPSVMHPVCYWRQRAQRAEAELHRLRLETTR